MKSLFNRDVREYKVNDMLTARKVSEKLTVFDVLPPLQELFTQAVEAVNGITNPFIIKEVFAGYMPPAIIEKIRQQLLYHMQPGFMILEGLTDGLSDSEPFITGLTSLISLPVSFPGEGGMVIRIKAKKGAANNPSFANAADFFLHIDLSYVLIPPDILTMQCKRPAVNGGGESLFGSMGDIIHLLPYEIIHQLMLPQFIFKAPDHYHAGRNEEQSEVSVLNVTDAGLRVRFRLDKITATTAAGGEAIEVFNAMAKIKTIKYLMPKNSAVLLNQRYVMHGREQFEPTFDEFDREFLRVYGTLAPNKYKFINHETGAITF